MVGVRQATGIVSLRLHVFSSAKEYGLFRFSDCLGRLTGPVGLYFADAASAGLLCLRKSRMYSDQTVASPRVLSATVAVRRCRTVRNSPLLR